MLGRNVGRGRRGERSSGTGSPWNLYQSGLHLDWPGEDTASPGTPYRLLLFLFQVTGELVVGRSYLTPEGCFDPTLTPDHHNSSCIPTQPELFSWEGQKGPLLFLVASLSLPLPVWMEEGKDISSCPGALPMSWGG